MKSEIRWVAPTYTAIHAVPAAEFVAKQIRLAQAEDRDITPVLSALVEIPCLGRLGHAQSDPLECTGPDTTLVNICTLQVEKLAMLTCGKRSYDTLRTDQRCPNFIVANMASIKAAAIFGDKSTLCSLTWIGEFSASEMAVSAKHTSSWRRMRRIREML
jgi:hypothetical protein